MTPTDPDAQLVAALAGEDRDAPLAELYSRYGSRLYTLGLRLLADAPLAEELVRETFVRVWKRAGDYDEARDGPVRGWILGRARETAVELHARATERESGAQPVLGAGGEVYEPLPDIPPVDALERAMRGLDVREAIAALNPSHREVVQLGFDQQLTQRAIAERLGVPLETVRTRTHEAARALHAELERRELL